MGNAIHDNDFTLAFQPRIKGVGLKTLMPFGGNWFSFNPLIPIGSNEKLTSRKQNKGRPTNTEYQSTLMPAKPNGV